MSSVYARSLTGATIVGGKGDGGHRGSEKPGKSGPSRYAAKAVQTQGQKVPEKAGHLGASRNIAVLD